MIHTNRTVTVREQDSIIDKPIVLYRGDREVEIEFTLVGNRFTFSEKGNVIKSVNASHGQLVLNTPSGEHMFSEVIECHEGKVVFVIAKEMIDEFIEIGFYSFQIRLYDSAEMKSRVTIPPVMNGFDIRDPIAAEDETNVVDQAIVDYARIFKDQSNEELPTFDWQGNYNKTEWVHHDVITENKLNKIEDALYSINANVKESDVVMLNTLDRVKKDADKYVKEHMAEVEADVEEFERTLNTDVQHFKIDTNAAITTHKDEVSEELESVNSQLAQKTKYLTPEQFGAFGDGVTDDTEAFKQLVNYLNSLDIFNYDSYKLRDCSKLKIIFNGVYCVNETITFPNVYSLTLDSLKIKALNTFNGNDLLNFNGVVIDSNIINCNIDGNLKTNTIIFSGYNLNINLANNSIHHFSEYGLKMINKGHEMKVIANKIYQHTWGEFVNSTPALSTGVALVIGEDRHDNRFTDNIICYCNENLLILEGGTNTFVNNHFYNGKKEDTFLGVYGAYNEFNSCYFDGVYINLYAYNNIKNSLFITNKNANCFMKLNSSNTDLWKFSQTSILGNKFKSSNKIDTPFIANGFDFEKLKCSIYDNVYDNVTPFSLIPSPAYNPSPFNQFKRVLSDIEGYEIIGDVKYMWGTCSAYNTKTLDCSKILNVQLTLTDVKATVPSVVISDNTFTPIGDGNMNYFAVCVI